MKNFVRGVLEKSSLKARSELKIAEHAAPLLYKHSSFRWHLDSRPAIKVIAVHDFLSSSNFWQNAFHKNITTLPSSQLTLTEPLEVYSVDLRGHSFSEKLMFNSEHESYASMCAADVVRVQKDVVVSNARLIGVGFGSMVSCLAALHAPDSFHSLTLLVENFSQLYSYAPSMNYLWEVIQGAPQGAMNLSDIDAYLKTKLPHPLDREFLLGNAKEDLSGARFRFNEKLMSIKNEIRLPSEQIRNLQYPGQVKVIIYGGPDPSEEEIAAFKTNFPKATFHTSIKADRGLFDSVYIGKIFLNAFDILGSIQAYEAD